MENENTASDSIDYSVSMADITSPSQLQEMTLDQDAATTMGLRSLGGQTRGRSVKELEDQLNNLKKENFDLKLRIYFLEEKMGTNFTLDKENIIKKNIELQVKVSNLQKDLNQKHEYLCQAVKGMELVEDEHKKMAKSKEEEMAQLQQEMAEMRSQLQDISYSGNITCTKSGGSSRHSETDQPFFHEYIPESKSRDKRYGQDGDFSIKENQLANFVYDRADNLRLQIDSLQTECENKDQTIDSLNAELSSANERLIDFANQVKEYEEKLAKQHLKNGQLLAKMQEEQKAKDKLKAQLAAINQKYSMAKYEFDQDREEFHKEKKVLDRNNMIMDMRISALESENRKQKELLKQQQAKVEAAVIEAKKNKNIAVSTSRNENQNLSNTDDGFVSVPSATTSGGCAEENALPLPVTQQPSKAKPSTKNQVLQTPDGKSLVNFEKLLMDGGDNDSIKTQFFSLKDDFLVQKQKIMKLKCDQLRACEIIKSMIDIKNKANDEIEQLKKTNAQLEKELENVVCKPQKDKAAGPLQPMVLEENNTRVGTPQPSEKFSMAEEKQQFDSGEADIVEQYKRLTVELEAKIEVLVETLKEKDSQMAYIRTQYDQLLNTLEEKENNIVDLEFELLSSNQSPEDLDTSQREREIAEIKKKINNYKQELEEKNLEIRRLNGQVRQYGYFLNQLMNKELWTRNIEIEKMYLKQDQMAQDQMAQSPEMDRLKKQVSGKDFQIKMLKDKIDRLGLNATLPGEDPKKNIQTILLLQDKLRVAEDEKKFLEKRVSELETIAAMFDSLKSENQTIKSELDKSEQLRHEMGEVCSVLSNRLEELAIFLDSLLKHKSVLGFLGLAKNRKLREIISNSLDMSRSFTMSLMVNPEQSLTQLSNITALLNGSVFQELSHIESVDEDEESHFSIVPENISLTYESHLQKKTSEQPGNEQLITALREQVFKLKNELQVRDNELNRLHHEKESDVDQVSESDDAEGKNDLLSTPKVSTIKERQANDTQSESEAWSEPDRLVSRARIGLDPFASLPFTPVSRLQRDQYRQSSEDDDRFQELTPSRRAIAAVYEEVDRLQDENFANSVMYKHKLQELEAQMQESKKKLIQAELEKNSALEKVDSLQKIVDELNESRKHYEDIMAGKDKEIQDKINCLEVEKEKVLAESQTYLHQLTDAQNQVIAAREKVKVLEELEKNLRVKHEEDLIIKLKEAEELFTNKMKAVEEKYVVEIEEAREALRCRQEEYTRDYIRKVDVEKKLNEAEQLMTELNELKSVVYSYENTISSYKEKELEIQSTIQTHRNEIETLQSQLKNTKISHCQLEKEKVKLCESKHALETEIAKTHQKEQHLRNQLTDIQKSLSEVTEKYGEQVTTLQRQKSSLELKISELESCNAELRNRLINIESTKFSLGLNATLPSNVGSSRPYYRRQYSDQNTYSSEDNGEEEGRHLAFNSDSRSRSAIQPAIADGERAEANSSPDLGIESDHGRFSSLENNGNNTTRPLLQTIEITACMNRIFDEQNDGLQVNDSGNEHCCQKAIETAQENNELKRKLLRMKRALEETATQLNLANQRKKQVEKTICKQIHKTSQVLRKAKANLDSGSESENLRP
uniref:Centrosomin N-terminal motif 1 domain-containing protein n=1 Tax=Dendroctonus ponderosae TaxID=77166 RepID=A0AAR5Q6X0_DENPD